MLLEVKVTFLPDELLETQMNIRMRVRQQIQRENLSPLAVYLGVDELVHIDADVDHCHKNTYVSYK